MNEQIKQDINALVEQPLQPHTLPPVEPVGGIPARRGIAPYRADGGGGGGGGGGIASPLEEVAGSREYYTRSRLTVSNTFLEAMEVRMLKTINFTDADNNPVALNFSDVVAP